MGNSQGFASNVYMEAQSDILLAGNSFKLPVTYWLPNEEIDSLTLRETKDSILELSFKQIAGSSFVYNKQFVGEIDTNKIYQVFTHSEDNWSDAHYSYRLHADYNSTKEMAAIYKEKYDQVNSYLTQEGANTKGIIEDVTNDYATNMSKIQLRRSLVSVTSKDEFDVLWGGLTVAGVDEFYNIIKKQKNNDELLVPYYPYLKTSDLVNLSETSLIKLFATKRPKTTLGNIEFDPITSDTVWLSNTPYFTEVEVENFLSSELLSSEGEVFTENNMNYEKIFDEDFNIDYILSDRIFGIKPGTSFDPVYAKSDLEILFVTKSFIVDETTFDGYFNDDETVKETEIDNVVSDLKGLSNQKLFGYKPKAKRIFSVSLEFQVRGKGGVIGKSDPSKLNIK